MRKNIQTGIVMIVVLLLTSGCVSHNQDVSLAICGSFSVPGMLCADLKGDSYKCVLLEEDSYGRVLFTYTAQSVITEKEEQALIICQKRDRNTVYYYEDICYLLNDWTSDDLNLLKERNDWNQPLDYTRMTSKSNKTTLDGYIVSTGNLDFKRVKQACCESFGIVEQQIVELCLLDFNDDDMELYWIVVDCNSVEKYYFVLIDDNYQIVWLCVDRSMYSLEDLAAFKQNSGW